MNENTQQAMRDLKACKVRIEREISTYIASRLKVLQEETGVPIKYVCVRLGKVESLGEVWFTYLPT